MNAIEVRSLSKRFGPITAVDDLTFEVPVGRVTGFLGPNGAGKTTTMRMILGLVEPDRGGAVVLGRPYDEHPEPIRVVGSLLDTEQFHPKRSGRNHLRMIATAAAVPEERVDEVLERVGLQDAAHRRVGGYSLGMRQRLGLASALLGDPQILVLDEPANGLDPAGIRWLRSFLRDFVAGGRSVLVSSHLLAEVSEVADDVVVIANGSFLVHSPVRELIARSDRVRVTSPEASRLQGLLDGAGLDSELVAPDSLLVSGSRERVGGIAAEAGIPIYGLDIDAANLEEIFLDLTGTTEGRN